MFWIDSLSVFNDIATENARFAAFVLRLIFHN